MKSCPRNKTSAMKGKQNSTVRLDDVAMPIEGVVTGNCGEDKAEPSKGEMLPKKASSSPGNAKETLSLNGQQKRTSDTPVLKNCVVELGTKNDLIQHSPSTKLVGSTKEEEKTLFDQSWHLTNMDDSSEESEFAFSSDDDEDNKKIDSTWVGVKKSPFDLKILRACIASGQPTLESIKGKDVVIIIGKTGSGKSTLIQAIAGKKLHSALHTTTSKYGQAVQKSIFEAKDALPGFEIGHAKSSMTSHINHYIRRPRHGSDEIIYIDSPGFEDSKGIETDVGTSIMLAHVAKLCKSIRFVIMINYTSLLEDRGGAIRGVLKMVRHFVHDFKAESKSFIFLFTHTNEINEMPSDLHGAREYLMKEIIRTLDGSNDVDALDVLKFMLKSLRKGYPFVDVFLPLKSDVDGLTRFIESKMKAVNNPKLGVFCGLTVTTQLRLGVELERRFNMLRHVITQKDPITAAKEIKESKIMFEFIGQYVETQTVQEVVERALALIQGHRESQRKLVYDEIKRGTGTDHEFSVANAQFLKDTITQIEQFDEGQIVGISTRLTKEVNHLKEGLLLQTGSTFDGVVPRLEKLKAWSEVFTQFSNLFNEVVDHIVHVARITIKNVETFDINVLLKKSNEELSSHLINIESLKSMCDHSDQLTQAGIDLASTKYQYQYQCAVDHIVHFVRDWCKRALTTMQSIESGGCMLEQVASEAHVLGNFHRLLEKREVGCSLNKAVGSAYTDFEDFVVDHFSGVCSNYMENSHSLHPKWRVKIENLHRVCGLFVHLDGERWNEMQASMNLLINCITTILRSRSDNQAKISLAIRNDGFIHGESAGKVLLSIEPHLWFDKLLPDEERFVENGYIATKKRYERRINKVQSAASAHLDDMIENRIALIAGLEAFGSNLPEVSEISKFGHVCGFKKASNLDILIKSKLAKFSQQLGDNTKVILKKAAETIFCENRTENFISVAEEIDTILGGIKILLEFDPESASMRTAEKEIREVLSRFSSHIYGIMNSAGGFEQKARSLHNLEALGDASYISAYLPPIKKLKEEERIKLSTRAKEIEDLLSETSKWSTVDVMFEEFEKAVVLDPFTCGEASLRLSSLRMLRTKKESDVNELLKEKIQNNDFIGMRGFLEPFFESKDQIHREKFRNSLNLICRSLGDAVGRVNHLLSSPSFVENASRIGFEVKMLMDAEKELKQFFPNSLTENIKSLKTNVNKKLHSLAAKIMKGAKELNFALLQRSKDSVCKFSEEMNPVLQPKTKKEIKAALGKYDDTMNSVSDEVNKFMETMFSNETILVKMLNRLKQSKEEGFPNLEELYGNVKLDLISRLNDVVTDLQQHVDEYQCYDEGIGVLKRLSRHFERGLGDNIDRNTDLQFDYDVLLMEWEGRRQRLLASNFDGNDATHELEALSTQLNKLKSPRWSIFNLFDGSTYSSLINHTRDVVMRKNMQGIRALESRDHFSVQQVIDSLDLMSSIVGDHIKEAEAKSLELKKKCMEAFLVLSAEARGFLRMDSLKEFQGLFVDYHSFILSIVCIMESADCKRNITLINQLVFDTLAEKIRKLEKRLSSFDFINIKALIHVVRNFGNFVADRFTLLREELKMSRHTNGDEWLDRIWHLCHTHFSSGRDFPQIQCYAILGVVPSASMKTIKKAYRQKAKIYHTDKRTDDDSRMFKNIKEALDQLESSDRLHWLDTAKPFDNELRNIGSELDKKIGQCLSEQRYDKAADLLHQLKKLSVLDRLVEPNLDSRATSDMVHQTVANFVRSMKISVKSNWSLRKYRELNENITDLKIMEEHFKPFPDIHSSSWNNGIIETIEEEITLLGKKSKRYLRSHSDASRNLDEFRRCFLQMGYVMVELPLFKDFTRQIMSEVLECCLTSSDWGYSYLFEFGQKLQKGSEDWDEGEKHVAQVIVAEFVHFKEVMTMVWNEETTQKPPEDSVSHIKGNLRLGPGQTTNLDVDHESLLQSFKVFENRYKHLLVEFIQPKADFDTLVRETVNLANKVKPLNCSHGWNSTCKQEIPTILAGIFTLFTVLKSGDSYNRIEEGLAGAGEKLLMKPHNIQVLTLLYMFGCGSPSSNSLDSQVTQIRTGEGKSIILGAAAVLLGLFGFQVRCVCYSQYLSERDFRLFKDIFIYFNLEERIVYSKITKLSEDTTAAKGDIRYLTSNLLSGKLKKSKSTRPADGDVAIENEQDKIPAKLPQSSCPYISEEQANNAAVLRETNDEDHNSIFNISTQSKQPSAVTKNREEILLVDEVDVFFGAEFYGQTYNQVMQLQEPEIEEVLREIWKNYKRGGRRQRLADVKSMPAYSRLQRKYPNNSFVLDTEISLMLDQVRRVDDEPYFLDNKSDQIGYKVMDSISFEVTYGYRTVFAYLKEFDKGNLKNPVSTLKRALSMPISCGQFSYANISPARVLGVSGTLEAMGEFEKDVMLDYGINKFQFVPSVYGKSNFEFDKAGKGISFISNTSDFHHKITEEILACTKKKRAVVVFFENGSKLEEYTSTGFYRKLGRNTKLLTEDQDPVDKEFMINKAATTGQITLCTAVFGRGTDFFCKDDIVQQSGGVHIIQTFLSSHPSEEIQIQGRTARQGKKGSYQLILLESDLEDKFNITKGSVERVAKSDLYEWLCDARNRQHRRHCNAIKENLTIATERDTRTHNYFDALLAGNKHDASNLFRQIYESMKKRPLPVTIEINLAVLLDVTGSMEPYVKDAVKILRDLLEGDNSISTRLKGELPETDFTVRVAVLGFRDIEDGADQFQESMCQTQKSHFVDPSQALIFLDKVAKNPSGGGDLAEDVLGAIYRSSTWQNEDDWTGALKVMLLLTDAPAHGSTSSLPSGSAVVDNYPILHPHGLTVEQTVDCLVSKDIDLFFCSFNPDATGPTEEEFAQTYLDHEDNKDAREIVRIPVAKRNVLQKEKRLGWMGDVGKHIVFVLDESGSMKNRWSGVVVAYNKYMLRRRQKQFEMDIVSVVQFDDGARITVSSQPIRVAPTSLDYSGGETKFLPAARAADKIVRQTNSSHLPVVVFMSDGGTNDAVRAAEVFLALNQDTKKKHGQDLELHVIAFGRGANTQQLQQIAHSSPNGRLHCTVDTADLKKVFVSIADGSKVGSIVEREFVSRISDALSDKLSVEYTK